MILYSSNQSMNQGSLFTQWEHSKYWSELPSFWFCVIPFDSIHFQCTSQARYKLTIIKCTTLRYNVPRKRVAFGEILPDPPNPMSNLVDCPYSHLNLIKLNFWPDDLYRPWMTLYDGKSYISENYMKNHVEWYPSQLNLKKLSFWPHDLEDDLGSW